MEAPRYVWPRGVRRAMFRAVFGRSCERDGAFLITLLVVLGTLVSACGHVAAYQREKLAHPTMLLGEMPNAAESHVNAVHEGATGGALGASSGCGCN